MKRVADTFVEVSLVFGFCCWLTPIPLTVLCVSTCCDGLLDFHISGKNSNLDPSFGGFREVVSGSQERGQVGHGCVYIIQVERRFSKLRGGNLKYMVILWRQGRSGRFAGFRIQNPRLLRSGGGRRWE